MKQEFKTYTLTQDHPLIGKKKGETVRLSRVSEAMKPFIGQSEEEDESIPTDKWVKDDIIQWLASKGVSDASGTKEELLKIVKKVSKEK